MQLFLKRIAKKQSYTIGKLYINGEYFCDTLEDADRGLKQTDSLTYIQRNKRPGITAIPTGTYPVFTHVVSPKYSNFNKYPYAKPYQAKMPRLYNVPGFDGILIHAGNTSKDTDGCILVGENKEVGKVLNSQNTWKKLMDILLNSKDNIIIKIE